MAKTYESMDWVFLFEFMRRLGFDERLTSKIRSGVTSTTYQVLVNRVPSKTCLIN